MSKSEHLKSVGPVIREFRKATGMSQEQVGLEMDVSGQFIGQLENGKSYPSLSTLARVAKAMGAKPGDLFQAIIDREDELTG